MPRFEELKLGEWYRVVVPTFLVRAGDGFTVFETCGRNHQLGDLDWKELIKYMKKISPILVGEDRRAIFLNGTDPQRR